MGDTNFFACSHFGRLSARGFHFGQSASSLFRARRRLRLRGRRGLRSEEKEAEAEDALKLFIMSGRPRVT
ncbi:hypothetical protein E2320_012290 [Naja naja]|nr:hypothetical protein E2320_012290 [Naja naja]